MNHHRSIDLERSVTQSYWGFKSILHGRNHVTDFNARNKCLTAKLLQQGYRYHKLRKTFSKFYRRHYELISKYNVRLKGTSRQRSGKGAIRKRFPLQKPRWEKAKLTIRYLYHETRRKPNEQLFSQ